MELPEESIEMLRGAIMLHVGERVFCPICESRIKWNHRRGVYIGHHEHCPIELVRDKKAVKTS